LGRGGIETVFEDGSASCFAHEAHHAARYVAAGSAVFDDRVISAAVFEGLATAFEEEITGNVPPWGLYDDVEADWWVEELRQLAPGTNSRPWRFLHPDGRRWIAYRAGKRIIDRAKQATGSTAADLVAASTDEVLDVIDRR